ncbi:MAG: TetR/AcrR family transcriptional regulator [Myxococcales bacterium]|nr:TetR/AcrR family transcriptional regulator [Myxococcales bacterium]
MSRNQRAGLREAIIRTSLDIGSELGEEGLTMRGIAARLSVSATALYQHFESKAAILREIRFYGANLLQREVLGTAEGLSDPLERLEAACHNYITFARTHPWLYSVLTENEQIDYATMNPDDLTQLLKPLTTLRTWLREGVERGRVVEGVDPDMTSIRMWAALHGVCSMLNSGRIDENHPAFPVADQQSFLQGFVASVMRTITVRPGSEPAT